MSETPQAAIAVITRTRNRPLLLKRCLQSVHSQSFTDFIHVIVNDGGEKEEVEKLVKQYAPKNRVVIHNKASRGLTPALNQGINAVKSTYITIIDDDDTWHKDRLKLIHEHLENTGAVGVVDTMDRVVEKIEGQSVITVSKDRWHPETHAINLYKQCLDNYMSNGCFTYRRSAYNQLKGYDEQLGVAEDWDFGIRFLLKYDVDFLDTKEALSFYHQRPEQKGETGNSVFAGRNEHVYQLNMLANKYLRDDINSGKFGIGYIMNDLAYRREKTQDQEEKDLKNIVRLEGHVNYASEEIKQLLLRYNARKLSSAIKRRLGLGAK